jgi:urea transport system substrate-binding protein
MGRPIEAVVVDPASNWPLFAEKARQLITQEKVVATFGCWTSVSRKSVLPVFKELNSILYYPVQYEGEELEKNVFYTGAAPNQQAIPATEYLMSKEGGGAKRFFLLGTDYVYPRTTNKILRAFLKSKGVSEKDIEEVYTPFGHSDYQTIVANIKKFSTGGKTCVISTISGDSSAVLQGTGNAGLKAKGPSSRSVAGGFKVSQALDRRHPPELLHVAEEPAERGLHQDVQRLGGQAEAAQCGQGRHQ